MHMRRTLIAVTLLFGVHSQLLADYEIGGFKDSIKQITAIVDATVTDFTKEGHAKLRIHSLIKGKKAPKLIKGVFLTCEGGSPKRLGMRKGVRYVVFLTKDDLFEERSYFEVREEKGEVEFRVRGAYKGWLGKNSEWVTVTDLKKRIESVDASGG